jgi:hypothetical protein
MSRQFRYRVAAIVLSGMVFGAPLLTNGTASAVPAQEHGRQVTFNGERTHGMSCRSRPDTESMVVPADSTVRVVNRTGYPAKLQFGAVTKRTLADRGATEVLFRRGTTAVRLKPTCPLRADTKPVRVTATPSEPAKPQPTPANTDPSPTGLAIVPSDSADPARIGSGQPKHGQPKHGQPKNGQPKNGAANSRSSKAPHPGTHRPHPARIAPTATRSMPLGGAIAGANPKIKSKAQVKASPRTPVSSAPSYAGTPPGNAKTPATRVPSPALVPLSRAAVPAPALPPPSTDIAAAEPMARVQPMPDSRPVGLLALIAVVCVMGVGVAAIRAIVSQRANRSKVA